MLVVVVRVAIDTGERETAADGERYVTIGFSIALGMEMEKEACSFGHGCGRVLFVL